MRRRRSDAAEHADPLNPQRWSLRKRVAQTLLLGLSTLVVTFASSVFSSGTGAIAAQFGIGEVVATLTTSLFVLGCARPHEHRFG